MNDLELYLDALFDGLEGFVYSPVKTATEWKQNWFEYPAERPLLIEHIRNAQENSDVYISPAVYSERRAKKDSIKKVQTCWLEFDGQSHIEHNRAILPSLTVQTSFDSHVHCYWKIPPTNPTTVEDINRRLTYYLGADSSGWDVTQLLRPPETTNHKHGLPVVLADASGFSFVTEQFDFVPQVSSPPETTPTLDKLPPVGPLITPLPIKLSKMVTRELPVEPYRSSFLARLANELAEENLTHIQIVALLKHVDERIGKYANRNDQLLRLSQIADYAIHKHINDESIVIYTPEYILKYVDTVNWILPQWLHTTGQAILSSAPGVGKTQFCLQLAYCLAEGVKFLNLQAPVRHRVLFMSLEMDKQSLKYILEHHQKEWDRLPVFDIIDEPTNLTGYENIIAEREPTVVIVDSLSELFDDTADNPNAEARRVMRWCRKIRRRYGLAIILIHHNRKATEGNKKPKGLSDLVGSFQFGKDADTVLQLWEDFKGIELSGVKVRYGPKFAFNVVRNENLWFRRQDVSNEQRPNPTDRKRVEGHEDSRDRHGDKLRRSDFIEGRIGFGDKD